MNKNKLQRLDFIDMLRGIAIVVMILLHTNAYFLNNPFSFFTWDWGQFAVPVFIFCSAYIFFQKQYSFSTFSDFFQYAKKRVARLLIPYYIFVAVYSGLVYLKEPAKITPLYIFQNLTLTGGIDINWLVLLFVYFIFIMPFIQWCINKNKLLFIIYSSLSVIFSFLLILNSNFLILSYRFVMWLPWSLLIIANYFIVKYEKSLKIILGIFSVSTIVFIALFFVQKFLGHSTVQYYNKYPPNLYHLAFGISSTIIAFWVGKNNWLSLPLLKQLLSFLSKHSYSIYFIHYSIIFFLTVFTKIKFSWVTFFLYVFVLSLLMQVVINKIVYLFSALKRGPTI